LKIIRDAERLKFLVFRRGQQSVSGIGILPISIFEVGSGHFIVTSQSEMVPGLQEVLRDCTRLFRMNPVCEEKFDESVQILGQVESDLRVEIEGGNGFRRDRGADEFLFNNGRDMNPPITRWMAPLHGVPPLDETPLLADVDLLSTSNQTDHDAPARNPAGELDEMLRLRFRARMSMCLRDHIPIKCPLSLVKYENMLGGYPVPASGIPADVFLHSADEGFPVPACPSQFVL
jgi:hypothetical protein